MNNLFRKLLIGLGMLAVTFCVLTGASAETLDKVKPAAKLEILGGGSQPIANLYVVWGKSYGARHTDVSITYKISNVVKGIEDLENDKLDFAGSEIPLKATELKNKGLFQFPTALISFTPVANLPGIHSGQLRLDDATLAGIFLGEITKWNDPGWSS